MLYGLIQNNTDTNTHAHTYKHTHTHTHTTTTKVLKQQYLIIHKYAYSNYKQLLNTITVNSKIFLVHILCLVSSVAEQTDVLWPQTHY